MDTPTEEEIKDYLMKWYLLFGERGCLSPELDAAGLDYGRVFADDNLVYDSTPDNDYDDTIWQLTPKALEIIKGK